MARFLVLFTMMLASPAFADSAREVCGAAFDRYYTRNLGNLMVDQAEAYYRSGPGVGAARCAAAAWGQSTTVAVPAGLDAAKIDEQTFRSIVGELINHACVRNSLVALNSPDWEPMEREKFAKDCANSAPEQSRANQAQRTATRDAEAKLASAKWAQQIGAHVADRWRRPPNLPAGLSCKVKMNLAVDGRIASSAIIQSSGNVAFDQSVEDAIGRSSPLPTPSTPHAFTPEVIGNFTPESLGGPDTSNERADYQAKMEQSRREEQQRSRSAARRGASGPIDPEAQAPTPIAP